MSTEVNNGGAAVPERVTSRYRVVRPLGQGGMARVYQVVDAVDGRQLALKQLKPPSGAKRNTVLSLFEGEYHALSQLKHPRVIEVYDYGLDERGPFYTMELLDGGDLADRSPLDYRQACALTYDVCSSLSLLHSRRLVHCDVSPRNVRCTHDGRAKLIDFGTMAPMGPSTVVAGTPAFVAPEVVQRSGLDGRADLYSLGATLYYALTKRLAYPARKFGELSQAWRRKPPPPSSVRPEIPPELDRLVLSLLSLDPSLRPRSAFEVMQRLSAIAELAHDETEVAQAYLTTPALVAREAVLSVLAQRLEQAERGRGSAFMIRAPGGLGRSRVVDACVLDAKADGVLVLRASATSAASFSLAQQLAEQLLQAHDAEQLRSARATLPIERLFEPAVKGARAGEPAAELVQLSAGQATPGERIDALQHWFVHVSERVPLLIAVDDLQRCDEASAALLAALSARAPRSRFMLVLTVEQEGDAPLSEANAVLEQHCRPLRLQPLTKSETEQLLSSVFGAVPNLSALTEAVHEIARGNPRQCLEVAQHLVDRGVVRYAGGGWTLPAQIDQASLPSSAEEMMRARIAVLDPLARYLAEAHALASFEGCTRDEYLALRPDVDHAAIDRALLDLLSHRILMRVGDRYTLARQRWAVVLRDGLDAEQTRERHLALASAYAPSRELATGRHLLAAGELERGLSTVLGSLEQSARDALVLWERSGHMRPDEVTGTLEAAYQATIALDRPKRERITTAGWLIGWSLIGEDAVYRRFADEWRTQLEHDSGYTLYAELSEIEDPGQRLMRALTLAAERFAGTPEAERAYAPEEAIRLLVVFAGISIAVATRTYDGAQLLQAPGLLAPFAGLSPVIEAVRLNALAAIEMIHKARLEQGRAIWLGVYDKLLQLDATALPSLEQFRGAAAYAIGTVEARMGLDSALSWAEVLERDPTQRVSGLYLRKILCLNHGDFEGAERFRKRAEIMVLHSPLRQMFTNTVTAELWAHTAAGDLSGVQHTLQRIRQLAERHPGWVSQRLLAEAAFESVRGDLQAALVAFEACLSSCAPREDKPKRSYLSWPSCVAGYVDVLLRLGRYADARRIASEALQVCERLEVGFMSYDIARNLALAEARVGDARAAWARLQALIEQQRELGVRGLSLGASYHAGAQIAIWTGDAEKLQHYGRLTAIEYRYGHGSPLGARYELLIEEARRAGIGALPELTEVAASTIETEPYESELSTTLETVIGITTREQRAERVLRILCAARGASGGHLYGDEPGGIVLLGSYGGAPPPLGLDEFLTQVLERDREQSELATQVADGAPPVATTTADTFCDALGQTHRPLVLTASVGGALRPVAVASLVEPRSQRYEVRDKKLDAAVVAYLVGSSDKNAVQH